jgi:hypothetical protein
MTTQQPSLQFVCPRCEEMFLYAANEMPDEVTALACPHCELVFRQGGTPPRPRQPVETCWVCGGQEFYVQKDFNRELGLVIVIASAMVIFLMMLLIDPFLGILCLLVIAVLDLIVYSALSTCTVCYLCHSIYRGFPPNRKHQGFYLGSEERFKSHRHEWLKKTLGTPDPSGPAP